MMNARIRTARVLVTVAAVLAVRAADARAQARASEVSQPAYLALSAGVATEPDQFGVRSSFGYGGAVSVGDLIRPRTALELRLGTDYFGAPPEFISPGGCLGRSPCDPPLASAARVITLGGDVVVASDPQLTGVLLIAGGGVRRVSESPERASDDNRPFVEIGAGVARAIGSASIGVDVRCQFATAGVNLPRWTLPIGLTARLF